MDSRQWEEEKPGDAEMRMGFSLFGVKVVLVDTDTTEAEAPDDIGVKMVEHNDLYETTQFRMKDNSNQPVAERTDIARLYHDDYERCGGLAREIEQAGYYYDGYRWHKNRT